MNLYKFKKQINLVFSQKPTLNIHIQSGETVSYTHLDVYKRQTL